MKSRSSWKTPRFLAVVWVFFSNHLSDHNLLFYGSWKQTFAWPVKSPHKGPVMQKMFSFDVVIMILVFGVILLSVYFRNSHSTHKQLFTCEASWNKIQNKTKTKTNSLCASHTQDQGRCVLPYIRMYFRADSRLAPSQKRRRYKVTPSLIGWAQAQNQPYISCIWARWIVRNFRLQNYICILVHDDTLCFSTRRHLFLSLFACAFQVHYNTGSPMPEAGWIKNNAFTETDRDIWNEVCTALCGRCMMCFVLTPGAPFTYIV